MIKAICLSRIGVDKEDCHSLQEAEEHIKRHLCHSCLMELEQGFVTLGNNEEEEEFSINLPSETACGAEWMIEETK